MIDRLDFDLMALKGFFDQPSDLRLSGVNGPIPHVSVGPGVVPALLADNMFMVRNFFRPCEGGTANRAIELDAD